MKSLATLALLASTSHGQTYCGGGPTYTQDSNLGEVKLVGNSLTIDNTVNCPGQLGVQNYVTQSADLTPGQDYTLTYTVTTCGGQYTRYSAAWIDFNNNAVFDTNEQLCSPTSTTTSPQNINCAFTVPADAVLASTRMRVMVQERSTPTLGPCDVFGYGGVKDFGITVGTGGGGGGGGDGSMSGGDWFLITVFAIGLPVYLAAGIGLNHKNGKTGMDLMPHREFWGNFPDYVKTGCSISATATKKFVAKLQGKSTGADFEEM